MNNLFFIDGISGAGKGSRIASLENFLKENLNKKVVRFSEPFHLRDEIKEFRKNPERDARKELDLFIKDRKLGLSDYKDMFGRDDTTILSDRSFVSSLVYQSLQGIPIEEIKEKHRFYPDPVLAFILLCDPKVAVERINERQIRDGVEISLDENVDKISRLVERYREVAKELPYAHVINTNGRPEAVDLVLQSHMKGYYGIDMKKAVFLDKDGTLVEDRGYPKIIPKDEIFKDSYEPLRRIQEKGYDLFLVSSQPWVARGRMTSEEVKNVFDSVVRKYESHGVNILDYGYCEHARSDGCPDKKPSTGLFERIIKEYNIDTRNSYMVGDMDNDILAGKNIGLSTVRINSRHSNNVAPDYRIDTIRDLDSCIR